MHGESGKYRRDYRLIKANGNPTQQANYAIFWFFCCLIALAGLAIAIIALVKALENPCGSVVCNLDNPCTVEECQNGVCVVLQEIPGCCSNDTQCINDTNVCYTNFTCNLNTSLCSFSILDEDGDNVPCTVDCNDTDSEIGVAPTWFIDQDGDGDGSLSNQTVSCEQPSGFVQTYTDCDDFNQFIFYGATQCNNTLLGNQFAIVPDDQQFNGTGDPVGLQQFGYAVDIEDDILAISAPGDIFSNGTDLIGSVRIYRRAPEFGFGNQVFILLATLIEPTISENGDMFGGAVSLCEDILVVGAPGADKNETGGGEVFVYERNDTDAWNLITQLFSPTPVTSGAFGTSTACFGSIIVVGESGSVNGTAYVFERSSRTEWTLNQTLSASDGENGALFGYSVAIDEDDGDPILVGAPNATVGTNSSAGQAYVFGLVNGTWTELSLHSASDVVVDAQFGISLDIDEEVFVVSAFLSSDVTGAAYIFENTGNWTFQKKLFPPDRQTGDFCGASVAIKNDTVLLSCSMDNTVQADTGSVSLFRSDGFNSSSYTWVGKLVPVDAALTPVILLGGFSRSVDVWEGTVVAGAPQVDVFSTDDGQTYVVSCIPIPLC